MVGSWIKNGLIHKYINIQNKIEGINFGYIFIYFGLMLDKKIEKSMDNVYINNKYMEIFHFFFNT